MQKMFFTLCFAMAAVTANVVAQKQITLEDIWKNGTYSSKSVPGFNFLNDGQHFTRQEMDDKYPVINQYDIVTGKLVKRLLHANEIKGDANFKQNFSEYEFSNDESKMLLGTDITAIYRHSTQGQYYIYTKNSTQLSALYPQAAQRYPTFSNTADKVAFVSNNNLFYKDLSNNKVTQITFDGKHNEIINGATDWVYEEEFAIARGFEWSPDGKRIAYLRFDEKAVPMFSMEYFNNEVYPEPYTFKYPKVGQTNATVGVYIYDLDTQKSIKVSNTESPNDYYPRIKWTTDPTKLCFTHLNRLQNELTLFIADATNGSIYPMLKEVNNTYININDNLTFLKDGRHFLWTSEQSGHNHLYKYEMSGRPVAALTQGDWEVTEVYGVDEAKGLIYYQAAKSNAMERQIYAVSLDGKTNTPIIEQVGTNAAQFSKTYNYFVLTHSTLNSAPTYTVHQRNGTQVRVIEDNAKIGTLQKDTKTAKATFMQIKNAEGVDLNAFMIKPNDLKKRKKYPVLMYVYGGPGSQQVTDQWKGANYWWFQLLAQKGYIVVCVDNRGTGARGEAFKKVTYKQLGKYESEDQIAAAKYLATLPYVDAKRIGIFGWSYGGFMATSCLFKGADIFKSAIAVAPVTNWKWYDSIYTERYMQTEAENAEGYKDNSPVNFADKMKGDLLLIHGMADDNVHFQNAAELVNALVKANKQFDTYYYPNKNHGISGGNTRLHLYTKMTNFLLEKL